MPTIINAYTNPDGSVMSSLNSLATSLFGGNQAQQEVYRQTAIGKNRENVNRPLAADALAAGDIANAIRHGVMADMRGQDAAAYNLLGASGRATSMDDPALSRAYVGAGHSATGSPWGVRQAEATKMAVENRRTDRAMAQQRYQFDNTPVQVLENGAPVYRSRTQAMGATPVLGFNEQRGVMLNNVAPSLSPEDTRRVVGIDKNPSTLWVYRTPDGLTGTTADGRTDINSATSLPAGTQVMKLEGANTEGLTGNNTVDRQLLESRVHTRNALSSIDELIGQLGQPNSDQAVGYLGGLARRFNDLRAQTEASVRLFTGGTGSNIQQEVTAPEVKNALDQAVNGIFGNAGINARAQALGINAAIIRSNVQDLAYMIAKAQDPGGRISVDDIRRASETIGATIMDPKAAVPVLQNLRSRIESGQRIREQETRRLFPRVGQPGETAPAAGGTEAPARIRLDADGNIIR